MNHSRASGDRPLATASDSDCTLRNRKTEPFSLGHNSKSRFKRPTNAPVQQRRCRADSQGFNGRAEVGSDVRGRHMSSLNREKSEPSTCVGRPLQSTNCGRGTKSRQLCTVRWHVVLHSVQIVFFVPLLFIFLVLFVSFSFTFSGFSYLFIYLFSCLLLFFFFFQVAALLWKRILFKCWTGDASQVGDSWKILST